MHTNLEILSRLTICLRLSYTDVIVAPQFERHRILCLVRQISYAPRQTFNVLCNFSAFTLSPRYRDDNRSRMVAYNESQEGE